MAHLPSNISLDEFLAWEYQQVTRHEFCRGESSRWRIERRATTA